MAAFARRAVAHAGATEAQAAKLSEVLAGYRGRPLSGYMAMRTEIDPTQAMVQAAAHGPVCVPVIVAKAQPLRFSCWTPDGAMIDGPFGARVPAVEDWIEPEVLIVPLVAFDARGNRLGYGGGFYDRTLEGLRAKGPVTAVGFAFAAQEVAEVPTEPTDQPLDLIVTEAGAFVPAR